MTTWTAFTTLAGRNAAEALGLAMERLDPAPAGVGVFEIEDGSGLWEVGGYFTDAPDDTGLALLAAAHGARGFAVSELPETDWVAHVRRELAPVEAGRFFVHGSHDADRVPEGRIALLVEAAMAFGTGHHGTTQGCLLALDHLIDAGIAPGSVADVGCGTAVLAMAAARAFLVPTIAGDIDEIAVETARANLAANSMEGAVTCVTAAGFGHPEFAANAPYDLVFANILKGPLVDLAPDMAHHVAPGGHLIVSGVLNSQAEEVAAEYFRHGFNRLKFFELGEWTTTIFARVWPESGN